MMLEYLKDKFFRNKEIINASWLIIGKIFQMILSLFVGLITARYLGPSNYGLVNYGTSYVALFSSFCTLGINSVIVKEFVDHPDEQGIALGTTIVLRIITAILSIITILSIVYIVDNGNETTIIVVALCSIGLIFNVFEIFNYWFQSRYQSKVTAMVALIAYSFTSIYKIILLIKKSDVKWFAFSTSFDYFIVAILLFYLYKKNNGQKLCFSKLKVKELLGKSYHYILAGMMVSIYGQTDKLMLKQMLDSASVGYYSTATTICGMWTFVLAAIIDSMYPTIIKLFNIQNIQAFEKKNRQLYCIVFYVSVGVSLIFFVFGEFIISLLYGKEYLQAVVPLKIITWYTAFSYLGTARNAWIVCENKQKYLKYIYISAAILNIIMNYIFIPFWGVAGAALASLITQILTIIGAPFFIKELRPNLKLMLDAVLFKGLF